MNTGVLVVATIWILLLVAFFAIAWLTTFALRTRNRRRIAKRRLAEKNAWQDEADWQDEEMLQEEAAQQGKNY